jgi:hypothetical protein
VAPAIDWLLLLLPTFKSVRLHGCYEALVLSANRKSESQLDDN